MTLYFQFLDCFQRSAGCMNFEAVPEMMRAFEIPKCEAEHALREWYKRNYDAHIARMQALREN